MGYVARGGTFFSDGVCHPIAAKEGSQLILRVLVKYRGEYQRSFQSILSSVLAETIFIRVLLVCANNTS